MSFRSATGLLPAVGAAGKASRFFSGAKERLSLVDAFLLLGLRIGVRNDARAGLHIHDAVFYQGGTQHDAGVHLAGGGEIADRAGIEPTLFLLQLVDDLHRAHFRRPGNGASRETAGERVNRVVFIAEPAFHIRDDVHDVAVTLDKKLIRDCYRADFGNAAYVIAAKIEQHQMLGALLRIGKEFVLQRLVFVRRSSARPSAGDRADGDFAVLQLYQDFRTRPGDGETAQVDEIKIRRRIDPAQGAV